MTTRLCLLPPDVALALSPARVRRLRRMYDGLEGFDENDPIAIARALSFRELPVRTTELLHDAVYLATAEGHEAILEAMRGRKDLAPWLTLTSVDVAIDLARAADLGDPAAIAVRARARTRMGRFLGAWVEYSLFAKRGERPARLESIVACGRTVHGELFVDGWVVECRDGVLRGVVVHEGLREAMVTRGKVGVANGRAERRTRRPLGCDTIRWDAARGRIGFTLARPSKLPEWRVELGRTCMGDEAFVERRPSLTLKGPHRDGADWFVKSRLPRGATLGEIVACEVDDGDRIRVRGPDALGVIRERVGMRGYMYGATTRYRDKRGYGDATLELPNKLIIPDPRFDAFLREGLDASELTVPGTIPDDVPSLAPWEQPEWRWAEVITRAALVWAITEKILVLTRSNRPADESFRAHGSMFTAHEIEGEDTVYCCPPDFSERARDESPAVLQRRKLDLARLAEVLRAKMELAPHPKVGELPDGVLRIGVLRTRAGSAVFFLVLIAVRHEDAAAFGKKLRDACGKGEHPVAIVATGRTLGGAVEVVEVEPTEMIGFADVARVVAMGADAVKLGDEIEPWRWGTLACPCVLLEETREIYLGRVRLELTENQRAMLFVLARVPGGESLSASKLGAQISSHAALPDQVVRKAMIDLEARVRRSAKDAGLVLPEAWVKRLVEEKRGKGYRIGVGVVVR